MKENLTALMSILDELSIDPDSFYVISIRQGYVSLQGEFNSTISSYLIKKGFIASFSMSGYPQYILGVIEVTLT
jgi:hypothetical protein